jgi:hypothetical protein
LAVAVERVAACLWEEKSTAGKTEVEVGLVAEVEAGTIHTPERTGVKKALPVEDTGQAEVCLTRHSEWGVLA